LLKGIERAEEVVPPELWIKTMTQVCGKCDWEVYAYCLMSNHFHLEAETL
jgi:REP element-mobilizing transposase RayT